jgi:Cu-Zn family superoxide dismutase
MRTSNWRTMFALCLAVAVAVVLSQTVSTNAADEAPAPDHGVTKAICVVQPLGGSKVSGQVVFTKQADGVEIAAELTGLAPGEHGFHVHEFGDCSMMDGTCAGGHFNPTGAPHGGPDSEKRHVGDFGNIKADASGKATYKRVDKLITLNGDHSIIGRSIIVHAKADDLKTQPSGDAGARVGCGVIGIADPKMKH